MEIQELAILVKFSGINGLGNTGISPSKMKTTLLLPHTSCHKEKNTQNTVLSGSLNFGGTYCNTEYYFDPLIG